MSGDQAADEKEITKDAGHKLYKDSPKNAQNQQPSEDL